MSSLDDHILKGIDDRQRHRSKRRIKDFSNEDLADQLECLQRAVANQRGDFESFKEELIEIVRVLFERRAC